MLATATTEHLKSDPILKAYLKQLLPYIETENLIEIRVTSIGVICLQIDNEPKRFVECPTLDFDYWTELFYALANGDGEFFDLQKQPKVSTRLPGGHRFEGCLGQKTKKDINVTIRIKRHLNLGVEAFNLPEVYQERILTIVKTGGNIVVSGGTGSGKTTFLNALIRHIPLNSRILSIEDTYEVDIPQVDLKLDSASFIVSRNEKNPAVGYPEFLDHFVRSTPDVIIAGEVSIANAFPIIRMMNGGESGVMCTLHAENAELALTLTIPQNIKLAGIDYPGISEVLYQLVDIVIHLHRTMDGKKRVTELLFPKMKESVKW
jgi:Flp pilus assembly CpaF family ATPase